MPICPRRLACLSRTSRLKRDIARRNAHARPRGKRSKSSCGTSSTHAALHQRQCAPFPTQHSHLREEQELIMQDPQSIQRRLSASRTPARTVDQLSACQKRRRAKYNLLYFYRRCGPTNAALSARSGTRAASVCRVVFVATLAYPTTRRLGNNDFQPMEPKDHLHGPKP